jgi:hypothetical protein
MGRAAVNDANTPLLRYPARQAFFDARFRLLRGIALFVKPHFCRKIATVAPWPH